MGQTTGPAAELTGYYVAGTLTVNVMFLALLGVGFSFGALGSLRAAVFVLLWLAGHIGLPYISFGGRLFGSFLRAVCRGVGRNPDHRDL